MTSEWYTFDFFRESTDMGSDVLDEATDEFELWPASDTFGAPVPSRSGRSAGWGRSSRSDAEDCERTPRSSCSHHTATPRLPPGRFDHGTPRISSTYGRALSACNSPTSTIVAGSAFPAGRARSLKSRTSGLSFDAEIREARLDRLEKRLALLYSEIEVLQLEVARLRAPSFERLDSDSE